MSECKKIKHQSQQSAEMAAARLTEDRHALHKEYRCAFCGAYHVGHARRKDGRSSRKR